MWNKKLQTSPAAVSSHIRNKNYLSDRRNDRFHIDALIHCTLITFSFIAENETKVHYVSVNVIQSFVSSIINKLVQRQIWEKLPC